MRRGVVCWKGHAEAVVASAAKPVLNNPRRVSL